MADIPLNVNDRLADTRCAVERAREVMTLDEFLEGTTGPIYRGYVTSYWKLLDTRKQLESRDG
ncbi:MAG: hypothetical protein AAF468_06375 [Pseudomonadota bacterium]